MKPRAKKASLHLLGAIGRPTRDLTPELVTKIERLQRFQGLGAQSIYAVGRTGDGKPIEIELLALLSPLDAPPREAARNELREINHALSQPPPAAKPPRFPQPRDGWRDSIAAEPGLRGLIESSPIPLGESLLASNCERFADALFPSDTLVKVNGATVGIYKREELRGKLTDFALISPCVFADRNDTIKAKPYQVLVAGGNIDLQAKRISFVAKSFALVAVIFDGKSALEAWFKVESDDSREKLMCEWSALGGDTITRPLWRMPDARRNDLTPSISYLTLESAGMDELLDRPRGMVREGADRRPLLLYLAA